MPTLQGSARPGPRHACPLRCGILGPTDQVPNRVERDESDTLGGLICAVSAGPLKQNDFTVDGAL